MKHPIRIRSIRPLVRYVDADQAVIDAHFCTLPTVASSKRRTPSGDRAVDVEIEIDGSDGFHDEGRTRVQLSGHRGSVRFEVVSPQRWWPAGMGEQALYELKVRLADDETEAEHRVTFGLTSVRRDRVLGEGFDASLLVNGTIFDINSIVVVDKVDEHSLLPSGGDSLLLVRDHFGTEVLYEAADRAGILLVQCVPIDAEGKLELSVAEQVDRLASHPSLAGYFVGHLGKLTSKVAEALRALDPTRGVYLDFPLLEAV